MAEALAGIGHNGSGTIQNPLAGINQAQYLRLLEEYEDADRAVADAVQQRKDQRAKIKGLGIPLKAWDRARRDADISGEKREIEELAYRQMMAWRMKPVGFQASFDLKTEDPGQAALNVHELHRIDNEGFDAGKGGRRRDSNSYTPGTEAYQRFDVAWVRGQAEIAATLGGPGDGQGAAPPSSDDNGARRPRRVRRGAVAEDEKVVSLTSTGKRRGRPPGSKNKPKATAEPVEQVH